MRCRPTSIRLPVPLPQGAHRGTHLSGIHIIFDQPGGAVEIDDARHKRGVGCGFVRHVEKTIPLADGGSKTYRYFSTDPANHIAEARHVLEATGLRQVGRG